MKRNSLNAMKEEFQEYRRSMHRNPQTAYEETFASDLVANKLDEWGIPYKRGFGKTGLVATIEGQKVSSGKKIGLRADMDALDIDEQSKQSWSSEIPGKMHACGHDGHTTILLGTAKYLNSTKNFDGTVHLIFQPAEEGWGGAKAMMKDGLFDEFPCDEVYGMHNWPWLDVGKMAVRTGHFFAASDTLNLELQAKGGHAAMPLQTIDPITIASHIVQSLQTIISREIDPTDQAVISVTNLNAGTGASNIIPDTATLSASIRSFETSTRRFIHKRIEEIAHSVAQAHRAEITKFHINEAIDPTVNHPDTTQKGLSAAKSVFGDKNCNSDHPLIMGGEDFGAFAVDRPGCYILVGQKDPKKSDSPHNFGLHSPYYDFNDDILPIAMDYFAEIVEQTMPLKK